MAKRVAQTGSRSWVRSTPASTSAGGFLDGKKASPNRVQIRQRIGRRRGASIQPQPRPRRYREHTGGNERPENCNSRMNVRTLSKHTFMRAPSAGVDTE